MVVRAGCRILKSSCFLPFLEVKQHRKCVLYHSYTAKQAIWLVYTRVVSGNYTDEFFVCVCFCFKVSLWINYQMVFPVQDCVILHLECCSMLQRFQKWTCLRLELFNHFWKSRDIPHAGSRNFARKTSSISLMIHGKKHSVEQTRTCVGYYQKFYWNLQPSWCLAEM